MSLTTDLDKAYEQLESGKGKYLNKSFAIIKDVKEPVFGEVFERVFVYEDKSYPIQDVTLVNKYILNLNEYYRGVTYPDLYETVFAKTEKEARELISIKYTTEYRSKAKIIGVYQTWQ